MIVDVNSNVSFIIFVNFFSLVCLFKGMGNILWYFVKVIVINVIRSFEIY